MGYYVQSWIAFLQGVETLVAIPLCLGGAALVLAGWRIWPVAAFGCFAVVGALAGHAASGDTDWGPILAVGGGLLLGLIGLLLRSHSTTVLGGVIGGALASLALERSGIVGPPQWVGIAVGFLGSAAWTYLDRKRVAIAITAFCGAILLISGLSVMVADLPSLSWFFRSLRRYSSFAVPFFLLVPTVVGVMLQSADSAQKESGMVRG